MGEDISVRLSKKWNQVLVIKTLVILYVFSSVTIISNYLLSKESLSVSDTFGVSMGSVLQTITFVLMVIFLSVTFITSSTIAYVLYKYTDEDFVITFGEDKISYRTVLNYGVYTISREELEGINIQDKGSRGIEVTLVYKKSGLSKLLGKSYDLSFMVDSEDSDKLSKLIKYKGEISND